MEEAYKNFNHLRSALYAIPNAIDKQYRITFDN